MNSLSVQTNTSSQNNDSSRGRLARAFATMAALLSVLGFGLATPSTVRAATTVPFKLAANLSAVQVAPGSSVTVTVSSTRTKGFTSPIYLGVTGIVRGLTVQLSRNPLTTGGSSTQITISPSATFAPKNLSLTVSGSSKGKTSRVVVKVAVTRGGSGSTIPTLPSTTLTPTPTTPTIPPTSTTLPAAPTTTLAPSTTTTVPINDYTLAVEPTSIPISLGGTATATLRINRIGGFNQALDATIENMPTGMTGSVDPIGPTDIKSTIRLAASTAVVVGTYDLTVRARGRAALLKVTVSGNAVSSTPSSLTVSQGSTATSTVSLARPASTSIVTWSIDVLPVGVTATFNPNGSTSTSATLTVAAASSAGTGTYTVTLRASSDGGSATAPLTVIVTAGSVGATVTPSVVNLAPGGNASVTVTPGALPAGSPSLSASGLPAGTAAAISLTGATFTYNFTIPSTTAVGAYPVVFTVTQGGANSVGTMTLVVSTNTNTTSFTLQPQPASATIARGATGIVTVLVTWSVGVAQQPITFGVTGAPSGSVISYTANPNSLGTTVSVAIPAGATAGSYTLTITGSVPAYGTYTVNVPLTVT